MSKNVAMFVDVANMYYAARGQDVDVDYVALLKHATKGRDLIRAYAYTGLDPENENQRKFIDFLAKNGYKPVIKDIRKFGDGRMKANLDIELVVDLFRLADRMDIAVIVSGDGDFAPAIRALQDKGVRCEVISFKPNTSSDLIAVADEFMDIMKVASISRKEGRAVRESMSAPEMPAKEVTPEFGFREASPSVAAAALAALKGAGTDGRRTRATGARRAAAPMEEPAGERVAVAPTGETAPAADAASEGDEQARRRRRRRGGRGRGRSRSDGATSSEERAEPSEEGAAGPADEAIAWEEFDDLSQIEQGEREYTFEEADAATLAELGLTGEADQAESDAPAANEDAPAPRPRSSRGRRKADTAGEAPDDDAGDKPKARRGTTRSRKADESGGAQSEATDGSDQAGDSKPRGRATGGGGGAKEPAKKADADAGADAAPARRSGRVSRKAESNDAGAESEPQGIWGRFRSARRPPTAG